MPKGPYDPALDTITNALRKGDLKKNETLSLDDVERRTKVSRNTLALYLDREDYKRLLESKLKAVTGEATALKSIAVPRKGTARGMRIEGCKYGPLGIVPRPVIPRFQQWRNERPPLGQAVRLW